MGQIVMAGATGLVGGGLVPALVQEGHEVRILSREPSRHALPGPVTFHPWEDLGSVLEGSDVVINLAGASLGDHRWTGRRRQELRDSRIGSTTRLVSALGDCSRRPSLLIQSSAIGYYGSAGEEILDERSPAGTGFLPDLCQEWEARANQAGTLGMRVIQMRLGVVLSARGGALPPMAAPFRWGLGACLGSGDQGFSWIHIQDLVALALTLMASPGCEGAFNATAPFPCSHRDLARHLATRLRSPLWPLPAPLSQIGVRALLGERGQALLLEGAYVRPTRALEMGFTFRFQTIDQALDQALGDLL